MRKTFDRREVKCLDCGWVWSPPYKPSQYPGADIEAARQHALRKGHRVRLTTHEIYYGRN